MGGPKSISAQRGTQHRRNLINERAEQRHGTATAELLSILYSKEAN
jgi:hypothetical protein